MPEEKTQAPASANLDERLRVALSSSVPRLYANSFIATLTTGDVMVVLEQNGAPVALLNLSLTVTKTLGAALSGVIANVETRMNQPIMTSSELEKALVPPPKETSKK